MRMITATTGAVPNTLQREFNHCSVRPSAVMIANVMPKRMKPVTVLMSKDYHSAISTKRKKV